MAVGVMDIEEGGASLPGKTTFQVVMCSIIAAVGGLMFGYDIGISGGVTSMDTFLLDFFPHVYEKKHRVHENNYCKFDDQLLQLFTSSLYLAGIFASFAASFLCRRSRHVDRLNIAFQLLITVGILAASFVNYLTSTMKNGWRYSLGGAAVPALILLIGSFFIHETPASLIERGKDEEGKKVLRKIRGIDNIELEFNEIKRATEISNKVKTPFKELFTKSENRPPLVCGTLLQFFQQFTGINVVMFYAPVLFQTMGSGNNASLVSTVVTNGVNALATVFAVIMVDRLGRKFFLVEGATQMMATQITIGALLLKYLHLVGPITSHAVPLIVLILICIYVSGFAWSWGPLGWLIPSEIYQLEVRTSGYFCAVAMNMVCTFVIGQFFLSALCRFRSGLFFFFAVMNVIMGLFAIFFLPETRGVPIEDMAEQRWKKHWHWKKYFKQN
ncbi:hypothetical protein F2Q68_00013011 [Brassica cretica]|uniref:Major facilitator superfamily (MFS) profile domain-containing protein n=1 Tax=Brassica cretica TaxID=69181 RepID=A0A8S9HJV8_BRACR|nr:hypothetical protein F2Q68_00013011 [Brassica cretica]